MVKRGRKAKPISIATSTRIRAAYADTGSKTKAAKKANVSVYQVNKVVGKKARGRAGIKFQDVDQRKINSVLRKHNEKISRARIAKEEGLTPYMVNKLIKEHNY